MVLVENLKHYLHSGTWHRMGQRQDVDDDAN